MYGECIKNSFIKNLIQFFRNFVFGRTRFRYVLAGVVVIIAVVVVGFVVVVVAAASALLLHLKRCLQNAFGLL